MSASQGLYSIVHSVEGRESDTFVNSPDTSPCFSASSCRQVILYPLHRSSPVAFRKASVRITAREFDLLSFLALSAGRPVSRETLAREVWKIGSRATPMDNIIDVHVSRLREKIDRGLEQRLIHTVRGVGFMLSEKAP